MAASPTDSETSRCGNGRFASATTRCACSAFTRDDFRAAAVFSAAVLDADFRATAFLAAAVPDTNFFAAAFAAFTAAAVRDAAVVPDDNFLAAVFAAFLAAAFRAAAFSAAALPAAAARDDDFLAAGFTNFLRPDVFDTFLTVLVVFLTLVLGMVSPSSGNKQ